MSIRQILAPIANTANADQFMGNVFAIAEHHKAHVTVVNSADATRPYLAVDGLGGGFSPGIYEEIMSKFDKELESSNRSLKQQFGNAAQKSAIKIQERAMPNTATATFLESTYERWPAWTFARLCDLVVARRPTKTDSLDYMVVESALFDAQRPTLMLPPKTTHLERGAAVAWNGSLEAATALERAVDVLQADAPVTVIQIGELRNAGVPAVEAVAYLESHGFSAKSQAYSDQPGRTTEVLLQAVQEIGAGVLIAGAYSHSRMREAILGGVTANLMTKAHVPVFFAR